MYAEEEEDVYAEEEEDVYAEEEENVYAEEEEDVSRTHPTHDPKALRIPRLILLRKQIRAINLRQVPHRVHKRQAHCPSTRVLPQGSKGRGREGEGECVGRPETGG